MHRLVPAGIRGVDGGICGLVDLYEANRDVIDYDLLVRGFYWDQMGWRDRVVMVRGLLRDPSSHLLRAVEPDWWVTPELQMLREIEHAARLSAWIHTTDAAKTVPQHRPEPIPLTAAERERWELDHATYTPMSFDEARDFLGW